MYLSSVGQFGSRFCYNAVRRVQSRMVSMVASSQLISDCFPVVCWIVDYSLSHRQRYGEMKMDGIIAVLGVVACFILMGTLYFLAYTYEKSYERRLLRLSAELGEITTELKKLRRKIQNEST